jgi:hypothetical protein
MSLFSQPDPGFKLAAFYIAPSLSINERAN